MKKTFTNSDIVTMYNVLTNLKSRSDIVPGDINIFWANTINLQTLEEKVKLIQCTINDIVNSHFTEENSHKNGNKRVLNDDVKDDIIKEINRDITTINEKIIEIDIEPIPKEAIKKMYKINEDKLSFLEMTVMSQFIDNAKAT